MKIALCLSGQPRSVKKGFEFLKKNLLDQYKDVTIFGHTWYDGYKFPESIIESYPYERIDATIPFNEERIKSKYLRVDNPVYPAYNTYSMWYSVFRANLMKKQHEDINGYKFDVVIRSRFDYAINTIIDFSKVEIGKIYVPNERMTAERNFCSDLFAYGTSNVMDLYANTFLNIDFLYSKGIIMNGENMLSANLQAYDLVGENMVYVDMKPCFPPGQYNGNFHNIIRDDFKEWNKLR